MRFVIALLAALVALGTLSWFMMGPGDAPSFDDGGDPAMETVDGSGTGDLPPPLPPPVDPRDLSKEEQDQLLEKLGQGAVLPVPPQEPGANGMGDMTNLDDLSEEDIERVEEVRQAAEEASLGPVTYHSQPLSDVVAELSRSSGVTIELVGEDLDREPVILESPDGSDRTLMEILMEITMTRNLAFEVRPDRIVIRR
ncbi:MAG: DUF4974 domain-containing protein [Planctomycetota bacterium]|jgi:hypothetical protein